MRMWGNGSSNCWWKCKINSLLEAFGAYPLPGAPLQGPVLRGHPHTSTELPAHHHLLSQAVAHKGPGQVVLEDMTQQLCGLTVKSATLCVML